MFRRLSSEVVKTNLDHVLDDLTRLEEDLLVFLHVLVVGGRKPLHGGQEAGELLVGGHRLVNWNPLHDCGFLK